MDAIVIAESGVGVAFSAPVLTNSVLAASQGGSSANHVVELYRLVPTSGGRASWEKVPATVTTFDDYTESDGLLVSFTEEAPGDTVHGFIVTPSNLELGIHKVVVRGDYVLDENALSVDANPLGGTFPTGDGVPGGTFESWFTISST